MLAVSACGPGHVIKVYDKTELTCMALLAGHTAKVIHTHTHKHKIYTHRHTYILYIYIYI